MDDIKLIQLLLEQYRGSQTIKNMREADAYYEVKNTTIQEKNRSYIDTKTKQEIQNPTASNEKIASAFLRQSVNQKVAYGFGKPFILSVTLKDDDVDDEQKQEFKVKYEQAWKNFITPEFRKQIKSTAKEAINNGIGWGFVSIDENKQLKLINIKSETMYPKWTDGNHDNVEQMVRDYIDLQYTDDGIKKVNKVEFWNNETAQNYIANGLALEPDKDENGDYIYSHLADNQSWGKVPFIFLKSSDDEMPLLNLVRSQIDSYDKLQSKSVDSLIDDIDAIILLKGMSAEIKDLIEARQILSTLKIASVDENGDASYLQANINVDNVQKKLENLKKDIKEFSCTVNTQDIQFGNNPSGVALKASYQDLDTYMNEIETEFELFMQQFKYFFDKWLVFSGEFNEAELANTQITVTLDRDMMMNETELIENTAKLSGLVSQETLDNYNPAVESHEIEEQRREEEKETTTDYNFGMLSEETDENLEGTEEEQEAQLN